jgi:hypothetical protein
MRRVAAIYAVVVLVLLAPLANTWFSTQSRISEILALMGKRGALNVLLSNIGTPHLPVTSNGDLRRPPASFTHRPSTNTIVLRFEGEGLPYFRAWLAYDTERLMVVNVAVERLW